MNRKRIVTLLAALALCMSAFAQQSPEQKRELEIQAKQRCPGGNCPPGHMRMRMPHGMKGAGKWWKNSELVQKVGVSEQQVQEMEQIFQNTRARLIDLKANLEKAELALEPLMESANASEAEIGGAIDRVSQARAELEKAHAMMLVGIRRVMTPEQWKRLQDEHMGHLRGRRVIKQRAPEAPSPEFE